MLRLIFLTALLSTLLAAQTPLSVPNGLPAWAFNIPDKVQPPSVPVNGPVRVPGSGKVYEAADDGGIYQTYQW